jgi:hypothetical protein
MPYCSRDDAGATLVMAVARPYRRGAGREPARALGAPRSPTSSLPRAEARLCARIDRPPPSVRAVPRPLDDTHARQPRGSGPR